MKKKTKIDWSWLVDPAIYGGGGLLLFFALGGILAWSVSNATENRVIIPYWTGVAWEVLFLLGVALLWGLLEAIKYVKDNF